jgi:hypothetical protein
MFNVSIKMDGLLTITTFSIPNSWIIFRGMDLRCRNKERVVWKAF